MTPWPPLTLTNIRMGRLPHCPRTSPAARRSRAPMRHVLPRPRSFRVAVVMPMNLIVKNRPGEHARQRIHAAWLRALRKHGLLWVVLALALAYCLALFTLLPISRTWRAFWFGFAVASVLAVFAWMVQSLSDSHAWSLGKMGEEATAEALSGFRQRRMGWHVVNGLLLGSHGDIDHVLVAPVGSSQSSPSGPPALVASKRQRSLDQWVESRCLNHGMRHTRSRGCCDTDSNASMSKYNPLWSSGGQVRRILTVGGQPSRKCWSVKVVARRIGYSYLMAMPLTR